MEALKLSKTIKQDGKLVLTGLPFHRGENVEMIILYSETNKTRRMPKAGDLLKSGLVGVWKNRKDIKDSSTFSRKLRNQIQNRMKQGPYPL